MTPIILMIVLGIVMGVTVYVVEEISRRKKEDSLEHTQEQKRVWKLADGHESLQTPV